MVKFGADAIFWQVLLALQSSAQVLHKFRRDENCHSLGNRKGGRGNLDELDYGVWIDTQAHHKYY